MQDPTQQPPSATRSRRFFAGVFLAATLSAITGVISYEHGLDVATWLGNHGLVAYLVPLVPDLMIATSSLTLLEASSVRGRRPGMAMAALVAGIGWTVAMNVAAGWREGPGGATLNAGVPLAFVLTFESLLWLIRRGRGGAFPELMGAVPATSSHPQPPQPLSTEAALKALLDSASQRALNELLGVPRSRVQAWAAMVAPVAQDPPVRETAPRRPPLPGRGTGGQAGPGMAAGDTPAGDVAAAPPAPAGAGLNGSAHG